MAGAQIVTSDYAAQPPGSASRTGQSIRGTDKRTGYTAQTGYGSRPAETFAGDNNSLSTIMIFAPTKSILVAQLNSHHHFE